MFQWTRLTFTSTAVAEKYLYAVTQVKGVALSSSLTWNQRYILYPLYSNSNSNNTWFPWSHDHDTREYMYTYKMV